MKFKKAIKRLGPGQQLGLKGTDWSWYFTWEYSDYYCSMILVDEEGKPRPVVWTDLTDQDWIIRDKPSK